MSDPRSGRAYMRFRAAIRAAHAEQRRPCCLCGRDIDYTLENPHKMAWTLEHVIPVSQGGKNTLSNVDAAHHVCQCRQGQKMTVRGKFGVSTRFW